MATSFPTDLDDLNDPVVGDTLNTANHLSIEKNQNDAVEALETKVGKDSSAVQTSLDWLLKNSESANPGHKHPESKITFDTFAGHDHDGTDSKLLPFIGARVTLASTLETTVSGADTKVLLDTETYDVGANFASNKFVAPVNGYYQVSASLYYAAIAADKFFQCVIYKNGASYYAATSHSSIVASLTVMFSDVIYLAATNYIELYYYHNDATTVDIVGVTAGTFLSVALLKEA